MPARPGSLAPGRVLGGLLVLVVSALAAVLGATAFAQARPAPSASPSVAGVGPVAVRQTGLREHRRAVVTRAVPGGVVALPGHTPAPGTGALGGGTPSAAVLVGVAVAVLMTAGLRRLPADAVGVRGRPSGRLRGRAPPAYGLV